MAEFKALRASKNYSSCEELARFAHKNFCFAHIHFFITIMASTTSNIKSLFPSPLPSSILICQTPGLVPILGFDFVLHKSQQEQEPHQNLLKI